MKLKVGDIINHKTLGLMVLTEVYPKQNPKSLQFHFHGEALFKMQRLISEDHVKYILYLKTLEEGKVSLATDEDIVERLTDCIGSSEISESGGEGGGGLVRLHLYNKERGIALSDDFSFIYLDEKAIQALKKKLDEII